MSDETRRVKLRVDLAHGAALHTTAAEAGPEVIVHARLSLAASGGEQQAWVGWPEVATLGDASSVWAPRPLPDLID
ncbi:MAG: hypothetical protein AAFZ65_16325, partial [Planctomycetota bacterium]